MKKRIFHLCCLTFFSLVFPTTLFSQKTKIACVGNSITEGMGASSGSYNYPSLLQQNLGTTGYEVRNFGASGRTLLKQGKEFDGSPSSYWTHERYQNALNYQPDIVIIKLGTNDAKNINWSNLKNQFKSDYIDMVNSFKNLPSKPKIYVCYPIPLYGPGNWINNDNVITDEMMPLIQQVANETGSTIIDLHTPFSGKSYLADDKVHPNNKGYSFLAYLVAKAICPECNIPALPADLFIRITGFDRGDKFVQTASSVEGLNLTPILDNNVSTTIGPDFNTGMWFSLQLPKQIKATSYSITSGNSDAVNAPKTWIFQGSNDGTTWTNIDQQTNIEFMPNETKLFDAYMTSYGTLRAYSYFRILISQNHGGERLSISEWQLYGSESAPESSILNNGGTITAEFNTITHEGPGNLNDKSVLTKYCTVINGNTLWIRYNSPEAVKVHKYTLCSANDAPERDPVNWTLYGSNDGNTWDVLDARNNQFFNSRHNTMEYSANSSKAYTSFRLSITKIGSGSVFQIAEWQLFAAPQDTRISGLKNTGIVISSDGKSIVISTETYAPAYYQVYTSTGQLVCGGKINNGLNKTKKLPSGIYFVTLQLTNGKFATKTHVI